ncbi:probable calcium homeostasis endoplasmic reticulum protein at N-terminal half [Coccomyxa sp. Obi]|nr:probable calcium homeostasis endoplasmic reticulum protein at N-terminal half [Coccomyxa sp. Obi]
MAGAAVQAPFFSPHDPPPAFAATPSDDALAQRISKLAQFAARNGPNFVELMRTKQAGNSEYDFLNGGTGSDYWRWTLYCTLYNLPVDQPIVPQSFGTQPTSAQQLPALIASLPLEVSSGFSQVLAALTGSKDSIRQSKDWFIACALHAAGMAAMMADHVSKAASYDQQLHVLYLANDVLLKGQTQRGEGVADSADPIAQAFRPVLLLMLSAIASKGGHTPEVIQRLTSIVDFWGERQVYSMETVADLKQAIPGPNSGPIVQGYQQPSAYPQQSQAWVPPVIGGPPTFPEASQQLPYSAAPYGSAAPGAWDMRQQQMPPPAYAAFPPPDALQRPSRWGNASGAPGWQQPPPQPFPGAAYPPPGVPPFSAVPGIPPAAFTYPPPNVPPAPVPVVPHKEPYDPMSFPPGLIPTLVREKNLTDPPYSPLSPLDIEQAGLPPAHAPDAYLTSRIEKFNAELKDYRPGVTRAQLEEEQRRQRIRDGLEPEASAADQRRSGPEFNDGSFSRSGGRGNRDEPRAAGLGYGGGGGSPQRGGLGGGGGGDQEDPYNSYRKQRAGAYHDLMARAAAAATAPKAAPL